MLLSIFLSAGLLSASLHGGLEEPLTDSLHAVTVTADKGVVISRTDTIDVDNSSTISEILMQSTSLHVGDNGGLSGLKTISLRGMGSAHTSVYIDGVRVGNVQSGQNDLGMIGLENLGSTVVDYAQNSVSFNTARPSFDKLPFSGTARFLAGSFGTYLPSFRMDFRLSDKVSLSANAAGVFSKGDFGYGDGLFRENNDVSQIRGGLDLFGSMDRGEYHVKAYCNSVERGTPGSTSWPSSDRQKDINTFIQGVLKKNFSPLYTLRLSAKGGYDEIFYESDWGDSRYGQTEFQLNSAHDFQITGWWKMSLAADLQWDGLESTNYNASRTTVISAAASSFRTGRFSADIALEYNGAFDKGGLKRNVFLPSADARLRLLECLDITAFGRRAYRIPTFNELYYVGYGNPSLKPEDAIMTDIGLDFRKKVCSDWTLKAKVDGFFNLLTDKITSAPTAEDPNIWLPYNIGKVRSTGADVLAGAEYDTGGLQCSLDVKYTFQSAVDRTPDSYTFDCQIPYIARHTVILNGKIQWKGWVLKPMWQLRAGRTDSAGKMPDWNAMDLTLSKSLKIKKVGEITFRVMMKNLADNRYEISAGYPMPGRSITGGIEFKF